MQITNECKTTRELIAIRKSTVTIILVLFLLGSAACGKTTEPIASAPASANSNPESATPSAIFSATPSASAVPTPELTSSPEPTDSPMALPSFMANDFIVPAGSTVSREDWQAFLLRTFERELSSYSGVKGVMEAYGFYFEPGAGSGEYSLKCSLSIAWFLPGNRMEQYADNREVLGVNLTILEQAGKLSSLAFQSDYTDAAIPDASEKALKASYEAWVNDWVAKAGKEVAAIPAVKTPVGSEPIGQLSKDFLPPAKGEATADLDGDGTPETVRVSYTGPDEGKWEIGVRDAVISSWYDSPEGAYLVDIDETDKQREIAIADHGPSSDDSTQLFTYRNGEMAKVGSVSGILFASDGKGRVSTYARSWQGPLLTWFFRIEYKLDHTGRLAMMPTRWYASELPLKIKQTLQLYQKPDATDPGPTLQTGTDVLLDLSDISTWFHLTAADGTEGWIKYQNAESLVFPDGSLHNQGDVLDGIVSAD